MYSVKIKPYIIHLSRFRKCSCLHSFKIYSLPSLLSCPQLHVHECPNCTQAGENPHNQQLKATPCVIFDHLCVMSCICVYVTAYIPCKCNLFFLFMSSFSSSFYVVCSISLPLLLFIFCSIWRSVHSFSVCVTTTASQCAILHCIMTNKKLVSLITRRWVKCWYNILKHFQHRRL